MIRELVLNCEHERNGTLELMVYCSLSPCKGCCQELVYFAEWLNELNIKLEATLKFGNFNGINDAENPEACEDIWVKLQSLSALFTLETFNGELDWEEFLNRIGVASEDKINCKKYALSKEREEREKDDLSILSKIKENSDYRGM